MKLPTSFSWDFDLSSLLLLTKNSVGFSIPQQQLSAWEDSSFPASCPVPRMQMHLGRKCCGVLECCLLSQQPPSLESWPASPSGFCSSLIHIVRFYPASLARHSGREHGCVSSPSAWKGSAFPTLRSHPLSTLEP